MENLDPDSVQHHGDNALAMTRQFGGLDLDNPSSEDLIYTSVLSRMVVFYPKSWSMPIAIGVTVAFLVVVVAGLRSRRVKISDLGMGVLTWPIATAGLGLRCPFILDGPPRHDAQPLVCLGGRSKYRSCRCA